MSKIHGAVQGVDNPTMFVGRIRNVEGNSVLGLFPEESEVGIRGRENFVNYFLGLNVRFRNEVFWALFANLDPALPALENVATASRRVFANVDKLVHYKVAQPLCGSAKPLNLNEFSPVRPEATNR
jgi:hypothetical protein